MAEELSIVPDKIAVALPYEVDDRDIDRVWVVYPVLVTLKHKPEIILDWEHTDYNWIKPDQLKNYKYVKDLDKSVAKALSLGVE